MSRHPLAEQRLALSVPDLDDVRVDSDLSYGSGAGFGMDVYRPKTAGAAPLPTVIFVTGYSDRGSRDRLGCDLKTMASYVDWARLFASAGMIAVTYSSGDPQRDTRQLLAHLHENAARLGVDAARLGIWACSGNVPNAVALLAERPELACGVLLYGYLMDLPGHDDVARAACEFGFVNPTDAMSIEALRGVELMLVRAGKDEMPGLNSTLDRFAARGRDLGLALTLVEQPDGPHAFDIMEPTEATTTVIREVVRFLDRKLRARTADDSRPHARF